MFPREFKNWQYKMKVGTTINLCDQRPADSHAAKWRWNAAPKLKFVEKESSALWPRQKCWWSSCWGRSGEGGPRNWERQEFPQQSVQRQNGYLCLRISPPSVKQQSLQPCLLHGLPRSHMTLPEDRSLWRRPSIVTCRSATGWVKDRLVVFRQIGITLTAL